MVGQDYHGSWRRNGGGSNSRLYSAAVRAFWKNTSSVAAWFERVKIKTHHFPSSIHNGLGRLDRLRETSSHSDVEHGKAREAPRDVHVGVPEQLFANTLAHNAVTERGPWVDHLILGLDDKEHSFGRSG